jgi:hypothetical protein
VEPALEHDDRPAREMAQEQPANVARGGRSGPARQIRERDRNRILEIVGEPAEPGAEDDPDLRHQRRASADGGLERVEARGLVGG